MQLLKKGVDVYVNNDGSDLFVRLCY